MEHSFITSPSQASLTKSATNQREHWQLRIKNRERYRTFPHDQSIFRIFHHRIEVLFLLYSLLPRILLVDCEVKQKKRAIYNAGVMARRPATREAPMFAQRVAALRRGKGLSQTQFADQVIDYNERRSGNPSLDFIQRTAEALDVSVAEQRTGVHPQCLGKSSEDVERSAVTCRAIDYRKESTSE